MTSQRYRELSSSDKHDLTPEEVADGWHFCSEWDFMLIHKSDPEYQACLCNKEKKS